MAQDETGTKVKMAEQSLVGYKYIEALRAASFSNTVTPGLDDRSAVAHIGDLIAAASALQYRASKTKTGASPFPDLQTKQAAVTTAENVLVQDILANACKALNAGCFAAGTKLLTRSGWRTVESIHPGGEVLSRSEHEPGGEPAWKRVEERFERTGRILHLHIGSEVIRTTPEHPFFVAGDGWTAAGSLKTATGSRLCPASGSRSRRSSIPNSTNRSITFGSKTTTTTSSAMRTGDGPRGA